jgi:CRP-like cAMP-binding protein
METPSDTSTWPHRSLLAALRPSIREELIRAGTGKTFGPGDVLLTEGARDRHAYLLMSGFVKVTATLENGQEALLSVRVGGDMIGEMAAVDGGPRSATVTACGQLTARVLQPGVVTELMAKRPEVAMALTRSVSDQLRWANRRRLDFGGYQAKVRLARLLVELAEVYGRQEPGGVVVGCRLTQPEIATLTGAAETTIHKALRELLEQGLLETGYRSTVIRDLARLKQVGELVES